MEKACIAEGWNSSENELSKSYQKFRKLLVQRRKSLGLSQSGLAIKVGVGKSTIGHVESGLFSKFPFEKVLRLAEVLNVDADEFTSMWVESYLAEVEAKVRKRIVARE